ncbi:MAG: ATP-binding protein, partial [Acidimicrobiales bacterium]
MSDIDAPSGTVTFLFTDIEGSTPQWDQFPEAMAAAVSEHDACLRSVFDTNNGYVFTTAGDSFAVAFASAVGALSAAEQVQQTLSELPAGPAGPIRVRVGLHTGEAARRDGDYFGPDVNVAARVMSLGHGGQVLLTDSTAALVDESALIDMGRHQLKGLARPRQIHQLVIAGRPDEFPPLRSGVDRPTNVPAAVDAFVGRTEERTQIDRLLDEHRVVTLVGAGGAGKTRLAIEVARPKVHEDGVWFVDLSTLGPGSAIEGAVADVVQLVESPGRALLDQLVDHLRRRQVLLVLDNCEHVVESVAEFVDMVLARGPDVQVLATSRERLEVHGEVVVSLGPLPVPDASDDRTTVVETAAMQLLAARAAEVLGGRDVIDEDPESAAAVCRLVDGLPLAIELAAARLRTLSLAELAERLGGKLSVLKSARGRLERHRTLETVIAWSYDLLDHQEQLVFDRLSVFVGGFTLAAAELVVADEDLDTDEVLDHLDRLVDKSLVVADTRGRDRRFRLLETLRSFSAERLRSRPDRETVLDRHLKWSLTLVTELEVHMRTAGQDAALAAVRSEHDNLRAARSRAADAGDQVAVLRITTSAPLDPHADRQDLLEELLATVPDAPPELRARACYTAVGAAFEEGSWEKALPYGEEAIRRFDELGDDSQRAYSQMMLAYCLWGAGRDGVEPLLRAALASFEALDDTMGEAYICWVLSQWCLHIDPADDEAEPLSTRSVELFTQVASPFGLAHAREGRGYVLAQQGHLAEAMGQMR